MPDPSSRRPNKRATTRVAPTESRGSRRGLSPHKWLTDPGALMTTVRFAAVFLVALMLQLTLFVEVRVLGVAPELPALISVLAGFLGGPKRGAVVAFWAGLVWDVYLSTPLGLSAAAFTVVAYMVGALTEDLYHDARIQTVIVASFGTAAAVTVYAVLGEVVGQGGLISDDLGRILMVASVLNALLSLPVAATVRWGFAMESGRKRSGRTKQPTHGTRMTDMLARR